MVLYCGTWYHEPIDNLKRKKCCIQQRWIRYEFGIWLVNYNSRMAGSWSSTSHICRGHYTIIPNIHITGTEQWNLYVDDAERDDCDFVQNQVAQLKQRVAGQSLHCHVLMQCMLLRNQHVMSRCLSLQQSRVTLNREAQPSAQNQPNHQPPEQWKWMKSQLSDLHWSMVWLSSSILSLPVHCFRVIKDIQCVNNFS